MQFNGRGILVRITMRKIYILFTMMLLAFSMQAAGQSIRDETVKIHLEVIINKGNSQLLGVGNTLEQEKQHGVVCEFGTNGSVISSYFFDIPNVSCFPNSLSVDNEGNIILSGYFAVKKDTPLRDNEGFVAKLTPEGKVIWIRTWASPNTIEGESYSEYPYPKHRYLHTSEVVMGITTDKNGGIYAVGKVGGIVIFSSYGEEGGTMADGGPGASLVNYGPDGSLHWFHIWGDSGGLGALKVAADTSGNIFVTSMEKSASFYNFVLGDGYNTEARLSNFNSSGNLQWVRQWGGSGLCTAPGLVVDDEDNIYVGGVFEGTVDFDSGAGIDEHVADGRGDSYLVKYRNSGEYCWVKTWGGPGVDDLHDICSNSRGEIYTVGNYTVSSDDEPSTSDRESGKSDYGQLLCKFDSDGNLQRTWDWKQSKHDGASEVYAIEVDNEDAVYITGDFFGNLDFDPGEGVSILEGGEKDKFSGFLCKLNSNGEFQWVRIPTLNGD
ncbi:MAG: hypothetical protein ABIC40_01105, partial [bacterium]